MEVSSGMVMNFEKGSLRSPIPGWISSWKREGIQLKEEDQKKGSMLYLASYVNNEYIRSKALTLLQASAIQAPTCPG